MDINTVVLSGNLGKAPEIKNNGELTIATFTIANGGWDSKTKQETTQWVNIVAFGGSAKICEKLNKGNKVIVTGKLRLRSYEKDGVKKFVTEVLANEIVNCSFLPQASQNTVQEESYEDIF